ncbi:MAG: hypothetical protein WC641_04950 [Patescibacteria group bacterium]
MVSNFDDNPYDDDDNGGNPANRGGGGGGGQGRGRGRGGRRNNNMDGADLAANPRFKYRMLSNLVQMITHKMGESGFDLAWSYPIIQKLGGNVESITGWLTALPGVGEFFTSFVAASIQTPQAFKDALEKLGVNPEYIAMSDEAIDSFIHGIGEAQSRKGKVTPKDEADALNAAEKALQAKVMQSVGYKEGLLTLPQDKRDQLVAKYLELSRLDEAAAEQRPALLAAMVAGGMTEEEAEEALGPKSLKLEFDKYRDKIKGPRHEVVKLLVDLSRREARDWMPYLQATVGAEKPPTGIGQIMTKLLKSVETFAGKAIDKPGAGFKSASEIVDQGNRALDDWNTRLQQDLARRRRGRR